MDKSSTTAQQQCAGTVRCSGVAEDGTLCADCRTARYEHLLTSIFGVPKSLRDDEAEVSA